MQILYYKVLLREYIKHSNKKYISLNKDYKIKIKFIENGAFNKY